MVEHLLTIVAALITHTISAMGYGGVMLLMAIESACIPLPSEVIMPFAGFLVLEGHLNLWVVALAGAVGCVLGSIPAYYLGAYGGRPLIEKYGRYVLISPHDLELADRWFSRRGDITVFIARLLPIVRTYIAFPAGVDRMDMRKFIAYTFAGSFPWCLLLAYAGLKLGENWPSLKAYFHRFDALIGVIIIASVVLYIWRHVRPRRSAVARRESSREE